MEALRWLRGSNGHVLLISLWAAPRTPRMVREVGWVEEDEVARVAVLATA